MVGWLYGIVVLDAEAFAREYASRRPQIPKVSTDFIQPCPFPVVREIGHVDEEFLVFEHPDLRKPPGFLHAETPVSPGTVTAKLVGEIHDFALVDLGYLAIDYFRLGFERVLMTNFGGFPGHL